MLTISFKDGTRKCTSEEKPYFDWQRYSEVVDLVISDEHLEDFEEIFPTFPWPKPSGTMSKDVVIVGEMAQYMFANYF